MEGYHTLRMDDRRRIRLPGEWAKALGGNLWFVPTHSYELPTVAVMDEGEFADWRDYAGGDDIDSPQEKARFCSALERATERTPEADGMITLPASLCDHIGVEPGDEVVLSGRGVYYEFWKPESFEQEQALEAAAVEELNRELGVIE